MKYAVRITAILTFLFTCILSCTKEVDLKTEVEFDITVEHNANGYIDENLSTVITVVPEEVLEEFSYSYSYSVLKGEGHFTDISGKILPQDQNLALYPFSATMKYVGAKAGDHIVKVTAIDNYGFSEEVEIAYTVAEIPPVVWTATSPVERIELGKSAVIMVHFEKSEALTDVNYERQYRITGVAGKLTDSPEKNTVGLDEFVAIAPGSYSLNFTPAELGTAKLLFVLQGNEGTEITAEINFEVLEDIVDIEAPKISLKGDNPYIVQRKTEYADPGATALDDVDGDISDAIVTDISGLNMAKTGTYTVTYNLTDSSGNMADEVSRTIEVIAGDNPESAGNAITAFTIPGQTASAIDSENHRIAIDVPYNTELNVIPSVLTITEFATVSPDATVQQDFTAPIVYKVKAENDDVQEWTVLVTVGAKPIVAPVTEAGDDITITLPTNSITLNGSASDADGTVTTEWTIETGGNATIANPTSTNTTVSGLAAGTYVFRLTATDDDMATDTDTVTVKVNIAPTVNGGPDQNIQLPTNTVNLSGSASDVDGTVDSVRWTKEEGGAATIEDANSLSTRVTGLTAGTYVFTLTATDNDGATAAKGVTVIVEPANIAPSVNPGPDKTIELPTNSVSLAGSANDTDGTVTVQWVKESGGAATISDPNSVLTSITGLMVGDYIFRLTGTDNDGASASETVKVTVEPANIAPTVDAGPDRTVTLTITGTTTSVTLSGSASDSDGTVTVGWTKLSGNAATITSPNDERTTVGGLTAGLYSFRLTATDNDGATAFDDVMVRINKYTAPPTSITYNSTTGVYTAPGGSGVTVNLNSEGQGKGSASVSNALGSANTSWNGFDNEEFAKNDSFSFTMPSNGRITFSSRHSAIIGTSRSTVTISNNQGISRTFTIQSTNAIP